MSTNEERRIDQEAARSVASRAGGVTRHERAMQRYLGAEAFATHPEQVPEGWADKPKHPVPPRTNTPADS
ncbi:MAG TPA: hypothetical protein VIU11_09275 [Nakamurella sp.]